ncbi:hypothetical protein A3B56_00750 [Candidatus Roizmanbacteria bacterium RIFCSPLOWO2_01_FULL_45_11]|uniref:2-oxoacid:ferredoxin oxidoreductase subunit alpha n=1 Tax=Candidatus Roizmanbacteria bacterium RIFCSPLOWO2_01_FULL_45_11 TaxID=1802070 RepID=A0A1F7JGV5_9BACT|nr:MAG: hypothetical protein A3B56_00750 [Candidatus Roizmanbacteria bacterium RIFCSPLOWO2_01_FULL_45_11]
MQQTYTFKIGGPAGLGIMTSGMLFSKTATRSGFHIYGYVEYPSLIRGGHNAMEVHFGPEEMWSQEKEVDLLVALNKQTVDLHMEELKDQAGILYDPGVCALEEVQYKNRNISLFPVPLKNISEETGIQKIMENNITMGAAVALFTLPLENLFSVIEDMFKSKGEAVIAENKKAAQAGYDYIITHGMKLAQVDTQHMGAKKGFKEYAILTGNEAIGMGAALAGCKFYVAYPMTPSSTLLHYVAENARTTGMVVRHAEDEIGVINEAIGASFAGARAMVGTSGGGFALMNEALSLAGVTETPITVMLSQRPGPATGLPTWTEQGDLLYAIRAGHGEFPKIVLAPGDVEEAYVLTAKALNMADIYQTPVIIMSDKCLSESPKSVAISALRSHPITIDRGKVERTPGADAVPSVFQRYAPSADGISVRVFPGTKGRYFQANSYEHLPDGHTTEEAKERTVQVDKRNQKLLTYLKQHFEGPKLYGLSSAPVTFIGWGGVKGAVLEAMKYLGDSANFLHFTHVWPMSEQTVAASLRQCKRLVLIENNSQAQFGQLLRQETGMKMDHKMLKYDGRPFYPEEIVAYMHAHS